MKFLFVIGIIFSQMVIEVREPSIKKIGVSIVGPQEVTKRMEKMLGYFGEVETGRGDYIIKITNSHEKWVFNLFGPGVNLTRNFSGKSPSVLAKEFSNIFVKEVLSRNPPFASNIVFVEGPPGKRDVQLSSPDGMDKRRISTGCKLAMSPSWTYDGRKILFVCYMVKRPDIFIIDLQEGIQKPLFISQNFKATPAISPDGRFIIYSTSDGEAIDLFLYELKTGKIKKLTSDEFIEVSPSFSPDGKKIAYTSDKGGKPGIYIMDLESGKRERITSPFEYATAPKFSPDGTRLIYTKVQNNPVLYIYYINEGREEMVKMDSFYGCENPSFAPSGDLIAVSCRDEGFRWRIYVVDLLYGKTSVLTYSNYDQKTPSWSPSLW
jgi:TolB protein